MSASGKNRLEELERRFSSLEPRLKDTPEKEAISILHAMLHEGRRQTLPDARGEPREPGRASATLDDVANLYKSAPGMEGKAENEGLAPGTPAPDFRLKDASGREFSLGEFHGQNLVLAFYPLDWSPACSDQLSLYQSELAEFTRLNARLAAISVDSLYSHGAWSAVRGIQFPLLSDFNPKGEVARRYRVYRDSDGFSERALFVIDALGVIRFRTVSPELHKIPDIYTLMEQLGQLQADTQASRANSKGGVR